MDLLPTGAYNAELVKQLSPEMQENMNSTQDYAEDNTRRNETMNFKNMLVWAIILLTSVGLAACGTDDVDRYAPGGETFGKGIFHTFDFPFYFFNIRQNAQNRVEKFQETRATSGN
jgi:hypothetical protein